jgi:hypothetical protein
MTYFPAEAVPGQIADIGPRRIVSYVANEIITPGYLCEVVSGSENTGGGPQLIRVVQDTGDSGIPSATIVGVAVFDAARQNNGSASNSAVNNGGAFYNPGDIVQILEFGSIFMAWSGTTQTGYLNAPHVAHSSTNAALRGYLTDAVISSTAGSEVSVCPSWIRIMSPRPGTGSIALVEINTPGAS